NDSLVYYMNAMSDVLKREVANVPIVYTYTPSHSMFINPKSGSGFDGIGIAAYGRGSRLVTGGADFAYSQSGDSAKTLWLLVTETLTSPGGEKERIGYSSEQSLLQDLDWLRTIGAKGFFVRGFQVLPESSYPSCQLVKAPDQLDWLNHYSERINREANVAVYQPRTLPFPENAAGIVTAGPIGNTGITWVPSPAPGRSL